MNELPPYSEFEKKLELAASAPSPDPKFVERLRVQMTAASPAAPAITTRPLFQRNRAFWTRSIVSAAAAVALVAAVIFFTFKNTTTVSAQQILARASAVQSAAKSGIGIWHNRFEVYRNPEALAGDHPGLQTFIDDYYDMVNGFNRTVAQDSTGNILEASASDGTTNFYSTGSAFENRSNQPLVIHRNPAGPNKFKPVCSTAEPDSDAASGARASTSCQVAPSQEKNGGTNDHVGDESAEFDQFSKNPRVVLQGKETRPDGTQAYILVDKNYETQKSENGQDGKTYTGSMKMVFDAQTYRLLESERTIHKDGQDIVIESMRFLIDEILPSDTQVIWDLSDLKNVTFVDDQKADQQVEAQVPFKEISEHELASHIQAYVLKTLPEGYTREIVFAPSQSKDQHDSFEINYSYKGETVFGMMYVEVLDENFIQTAFYDGSYKTASGLLLNFGIGGSSAVLTIPNGTSFLLTSTLPREKVQSLAEGLVPAK